VDAETLIPANKPGNQKQTHNARKEAKEPRQSKKQNRRLNEASLSRTEDKVKPPAQPRQPDHHQRRMERSQQEQLYHCQKRFTIARNNNKVTKYTTQKQP
jgi:hypothetical protein